MKKFLLVPFVALAMAISMPHVAQSSDGKTCDVKKAADQGVVKHILPSYAGGLVKRCIKYGICLVLVIVGVNSIIALDCATDCTRGGNSNTTECFVQCHEKHAIPAPWLKLGKREVKNAFEGHLARLKKN